MREEEEEVRERAAPRRAAAERVKVKEPKLAPRRSDIRRAGYCRRKVLPPLCRQSGLRVGRRGREIAYMKQTVRDKGLVERESKTRAPCLFFDRNTVR